MQCGANQCSNHTMWKHPWPFLRFAKTFQNRWSNSWDEIPLSWQLCKSLVQFLWSFSTFALFKTQVPWLLHTFERQSRKSGSLISLWSLWWGVEKVWKCQCLEIFLPSFRLSSSQRCHRRKIFLYPWGFVSRFENAWLDKYAWSTQGSTSRGRPNVRFPMV